MRVAGRDGRNLANRGVRTRVKHAALIVVLLAVALVAMDIASSVIYRTNQSAALSVMPGSAERPSTAVVLFPGFGMSGALAAKSLREHLPSDTVVLGLSYAERGVDLDEISQSVLAELLRVQPNHVYFYGASMGGLVANYVAKEYASEPRRSNFSLILDTAPAGSNDVRRPQFLFDASCYYPGGIISSWIWPLVARNAPHVPLNGAAISVAQEGREYGESVGTPALLSQACFLRSAKAVSVGSSDLRAFYAQAADAPENDPLVDTGSAVRSWQAALRDVKRVTIQGRLGSWHIPLVERPTETAELLMLIKNSS